MFKQIDQEDLACCATLFMSVFNGPPWNDEWKLEQAEDYLKDIFQTPGFIGIGFYNHGNFEGVMLGNVKKWYSGKEFHIHEVFIAASSQGKGLGKKLMNYLEETLKQENINDLSLLTDRGIDAEFFYKSTGFKEIERLVFMAKSIEQ